MSPALTHLAREARLLPGNERLSLALMLLDEGEDASPAAAAWESELKARIRAIDEGRAQGIPYEEAMLELDRRLAK